MYDSLAEDDSDGLTVEQFAEAMESRRPPAGGRRGPGEPGGGEDEASTQTSAESLVELLKSLSSGEEDDTKVAAYLNSLLSGNLVNLTA